MHYQHAGCAQTVKEYGNQLSAIAASAHMKERQKSTNHPAAVPDNGS
jgi:hypothetical protein